MEEIKTSRLDQFDILKGIGIILVMIGHAIPLHSYLHCIIYGFHMPLFFFCSGFFFKEGPIVQTIKKDVKGLLVPWLTFVLFLCLCAVAINMISSGSIALNFNALDENNYLLYHTIWFLVCLFIVRQLYKILYKICNRRTLAICCVGGYFIAYYLKRQNINIPLFIDSAMAMMIFYHIGYLFKENKLYRKRSIYLSIALLLIYAVFVWLVHPYVNIKDNVFPIYLIALSLIPIYASYQICCYIKSKFLVLCGIESLAIMGLHHPIYDTVMFPLMNRLPFWHPIGAILTVVVTLFLCLSLNKCMKKYAPFLLGKI